MQNDNLNTDIAPQNQGQLFDLSSALGVLKISGDNAKKFLQGQLTCNMDSLPANGQLAAHCNPQGRIISLFYIFESENIYYLCMPQNLIDIASAALKKYAVFFKVGLEAVSNPSIIMSFQRKLESIISTLDSSFRWNDTSNQEWHQQLIKLQIPTIYAETSGKFLPHELNLPALGAVDFDKGCYTGQEIIARMHYRGKVKTQLFDAMLETSNPPTLGADIFYIENDKAFPCGSIVDIAQPNANQYQLLITADKQKAASGSLSMNAEHPFIFLKTISQNRED